MQSNPEIAAGDASLEEMCHLLQAFVNANWWMAWTSLPSIGFMAWLLSPRPLVPAWWSWVILMYVQSAHMMTVTFVFRRRPVKIDNAQWRRAYLIGTGVFTGLCWGSSAIFLWPHITATQQVVLLLYMAGVTAIAGVTNASLLPAGLAFLGCAWMLIIVQLVADPGGVAPVVVLMCALFVVIMQVAMWQGAELHRKMVRMLIINQRLLEEVVEARQAAETANIAKDHFLGAVSHDLRQPAYALALLLRTASVAPLPEAVAALIAKARTAVSSMRGTLDALLDLTKVRSGSAPLQHESVSVHALFAAVESIMAGYASARGIQLSFRPSPLTLRTDPTAMSRILSNLVENAIRYTEQGRVLVAARRRGQNVLVQVWDTGIGISVSERQKIFEPFAQLDNPQRDRRRGLGLGLAIVHHLAGNLSHGLSVHSNPGRGSVFSVQVPLDLTSTVIPILDHGGNRQPCKVLLIDDDPEVREAAVLWLSSQGYTAMAASDVREALVLPGVTDIDAAIIDYRLAGGRNGSEQLSELCAALKRELPALIVTGDVQGPHLKALADAGQRVLFKPLDPDLLHQALRRLLSHT